MKKLNNALNEVHDNYIEEGAKADRLHNSTAKTIRNIAIPVASAAAVAGICLGLNAVGVFSGKSQGVDLLPADSASSAHASTTQTAPYQPNDHQGEYIAHLPKGMPLVLQTTDNIESIIFGSEFPDMLYADEEQTIFTDGVGGVYVFDFDSEKITFAADIFDSIELSVDGYEDAIYDSWNGVSIFALEDGTVCCSLAGSRYSTISADTDEFYTVDMENLQLVRNDDMRENEPKLYDGLFELPYDEDYRAISLQGARIGDTGDFVYIRNCTADIDLATEYNMQLIELRRWAEDKQDEITDCMDGGWFPFVGNDANDIKDESLANSYGGAHADGSEYSLYMSESSFRLDSDTKSVSGRVEIRGDIAKLTEESSEFTCLYRISGDRFIPLTLELADPDGGWAKLAGVVMTKQESVSSITSEQIDDINAEIEKLEERLIQTSLEIDELNYAIEEYEARISAATEQDIISNLSAEKEVVEQVLAVKLDQYAEIEAETEQLSMLIDEEAYNDALNAAKTENELINYMAKELGATTSVTGLCPEFSDILTEWRIITTYFGYDEWGNGTHYGIDIAADSGTAILAAANGTARVPTGESDWLTSYGKTVIIEHENGWFTVYAHANDIVVSDGEKVSAGQEIAHVGSTGWSTGPHLHFEVRQGVTAMDPMAFIKLETYTTLNDIIAYAELTENPYIPQLSHPVDVEKATLSERIYGKGGYYAHNGIDISAESGTPVQAAADGKVICAAWCGGYGKCVILQHDGYLTLYGHLDELEATHGSDIKAGEQLGSVGSTGRATGNHLHFEILTASDDIVDPTEYLPEFLNDTSIKFE